MKIADSKEMMSVPRDKQNFADQISVADGWNRVKTNEMRDAAEEFTGKRRFVCWKIERRV